MTHRPLHRHPAFTLVELMIVIAIIAVLVTMLLPALKNTRKNARTLVCMSNMRQLALAQNNYANQYKDLISSYSRKVGTGSVPGNTGLLTESWAQAKEIVQQVSGKVMGATAINRFFHRNYWHLPAVADGAFGSSSGSLISPIVGCAEDRVILEWKKNVNNPAALLIGMGNDGAAGDYANYRPYWSSYQQVPAAWCEDTNFVRGSTTRYTPGQIITSHHLMTQGGTSSEGGGSAMPHGRRRLPDVAFPSAKVWFFDLYDRHFYRRMIWHGYDVAKQPLVFFDSSVRVYKTKDCQNGFVSPDTINNTTPLKNPATFSAAESEYNYTPSTGWQGYDPPTLSGATTDKVKGKYRWTYRGLKGWDYNGAKSGSAN